MSLRNLLHCRDSSVHRKTVLQAVGSDACLEHEVSVQSNMDYLYVELHIKTKPNLYSNCFAMCVLFIYIVGVFFFSSFLLLL